MNDLVRAKNPGNTLLVLMAAVEMDDLRASVDEDRSTAGKDGGGVAEDASPLDAAERTGGAQLAIGDDASIFAVGRAYAVTHCVPFLYPLSQSSPLAVHVAVWLLRLGLFAFLATVAALPVETVCRPEGGRVTTLYGTNIYLYAAAYLLCVYWLAWEGRGATRRPGGFVVDKWRRLGRLMGDLGMDGTAMRRARLAANVSNGILLAGAIAFNFSYIPWTPPCAETGAWKMLFMMIVFFFGNIALLALLIDLALVWFLHLQILKHIAGDIAPDAPKTGFDGSRRRPYDRDLVHRSLAHMDSAKVELVDTQNFWSRALSIGMVFLLVYTALIAAHVVQTDERTPADLWLPLTILGTIGFIQIVVLLLPALITMQLRSIPSQILALEPQDAAARDDMLSLADLVERRTSGYSVFGVVITIDLIQAYGSVLATLVSVVISQSASDD